MCIPTAKELQVGELEKQAGVVGVTKSLTQNPSKEDREKRKG